MKLSAFVSLLRDHKSITRTLSLRDGPKAPDGRDPEADIPRPDGLDQRVHPHRIRWRVVEVIEETPTVSTLVLKPVDGPVPAYLPGQYVNVFVELDGVATSRPQSLSSVPGGDVVTLTIRRKVDGHVSPHLAGVVKQGDELVTSGPEGETTYFRPRDGDRVVLVAGGTGVAPLVPMAADILRRNDHAQVAFVYGARDEQELLFRRRLDDLAGRYAGRFRLKVVLSDADRGWSGERGLLSRKVLAEHVGGDPGPTFFVCGPRPMQQLVLAELSALGVPSHQMHTEVAGTVDDPTALPQWPSDVPAHGRVALEVDGRELTADAAVAEPLLNAMERAGLSVPALCRSGVCGSCRTRLLDGEVLTDPLVTIRPSDEKAGYILPCVAYPLSNVKLKRR